MSGGLSGIASRAALDYLTGRALNLGVVPQTMQLVLLTAPPPADPGPGDLTEVLAAGYARQDVVWAAAVTSTSGLPSSIASGANAVFGPFTAVGGLAFPVTHCALLGSVVAASSANLLTANQADVETDASAWSALANASIVQSTAHAKTGTHSLAVTSTPAAGDTQVIPVAKIVTVPFRSYVVSGWAYTTASGSQCGVGVAFYDSSDVLISSVSGSLGAISASTWTEFSVSAMAPAGAVKAAPILHGVPVASGAVTYWDAMSFAASVDQSVLMSWQFDVVGTAAQNESLQISAGSLVMSLG